MARTPLVLFCVSLAVSALLTPAIRDFALRRRLVDRGGARKVHLRAVPRVGGVAFVAAFFITILCAVAADPQLRVSLWDNRPRSLTFLGGGLAIALVGLADDLRGLRARYKLLLQGIIVGAFCWSGFGVDNVMLPGGAVLPLGQAAIPLLVFWMIGVINAMNLIDGLDGLAGGIATIALIGTFVLASVTGNYPLAMHTAALAGAVLGFLLFNFRPASIFMGDCGSLFLGYFLCVAVPVSARRPGANAVDLLIPLLILGIPIADTALAVARRALRNRGVFSPDREHLHHRLVDLGRTQEGAVLVLYAVAATLCVAALAIRFGSTDVRHAVMALVVVAAAWLLRRIGAFDFRLRTLRDERDKNLVLRCGVDYVNARLSASRDLEGILDSVGPLAGVVAARQLVARIGPASAVHAVEGAGTGELRVTFPIREGARRIGEMEVAWKTRGAMDPEHALAIEQVCERVAHAVTRVSPDAVAEAVLTPLPGTVMPLRKIANR